MALDDLDGIANVAFSVGQTITEVDDFEDGDLSEYVDAYGSGSTQTGTVYNGSVAGQHDTTGAQKAIVISTSGLPYYPSAGDTFRYYHYVQDSQWVGIIGWASQGTSTSSEGDRNPDSGGYCIETRFNDQLHFVKDNSRVASVSLGGYTGEWTYTEVTWGGGGTMDVTLHRASDDSQFGSISHTDTEYTSGGIHWGADSYSGNSHTYYIDFIHVL